MLSPPFLFLVQIYIFGFNINTSLCILSDNVRVNGIDHSIIIESTMHAPIFYSVAFAQDGLLHLQNRVVLKK